jgi:MTH538 TIR-like domain (DUF1863)
MAKHVFLSFVIKDVDLVTLFRGQAKNKNSDLAFDDYSVREPINSTNAPYIKTKITEKITASSVLICLIGYDTHKSDWVDWEIRKAVELKKKIVGVRLDSDSTRDRAPAALISAGAMVLNWEIDKIVSAIG